MTCDGAPAATLSSKLSLTTGDAPGTLGGVTSGTFGMMVSFVTSSPDVMFEGKPAVCHSHKATMNNNNCLCC